MSSYYCNCHQPYFLSIDTYNTKHYIQNNNIQEKNFVQNHYSFFCIPFFTLHTPTEPNRTTTICNCRSVAPGLIFGWTTQERQLKSCYLRRTKHCGSFRLNYHIFEHILYIYLIPENFQDIHVLTCNYRYHHFIFIWFSFKLHQISQLTIN